MSGTIRWVPLESNPEIYSSWASSMGLDIEKYAFVDIYGLDDDLLSMVPQPVEAVLLLFPVTKEYEDKRKQEDSNQEAFIGPEKNDEVMWFKQTIGNACGTIGLLHSIANSSARNLLAESSPMATLIKEALPLNAADRAAYLQTSQSLAKAHTSAASTGQTTAPSAEDKCDLHFVSFIRDPTSKHLFELDGRRVGPVDRGIVVSKQEELLKVATQWIANNYMSLNPTEVNYNLIALADTFIPSLSAFSQIMANGNIPPVIRNVTPNLTTFSKPFARFGLFPIGGRSTAIKLSGEKGVWVLASTPLDEPTKARLQEMGDVKYVVAGDFVHSLFIGDYKKEYPNAKLIGVEGLPEKKPELKFDGVYGKDPAGTQYGYEDEISTHYFPTFANKDLAFLHKESKSLILVDLLFNLPAIEQYKNTPAGKPTSWVPFMSYLAPKFQPQSGLIKSFLWMTGAGNDLPSYEGKKAANTQEKRSRFAKDAEVVATWDFERIIPSHGDTIEKDAKKMWLEAYSRYLGPDGKAKI